MLVFLGLLRLVGKILWLAVWVGMAFMLTLAVLVYLSSNSLVGQAQSSMMWHGVVSE